jgi:DNA repair protein RadC
MPRSEPQAFYESIKRAARAEAGKALAPLLKRWRYTQSSDFAQLELKPGSLRFLTRYGFLDAGRESAELKESYHALLSRIGRSSGDAPGIVAAWVELFAEGEYGVMERGVCAAEPRCGECPLKESCRFLVAGAKDARSFGQSLAQELVLAGRDRSVDLRAADVLAFIAGGEKTGAADIARAEALLKGCNGLRGVFLAKADLLREHGYNDAAIARIQAASELCRQWAGEKTARGRAFGSGKDFYEHYHLRLRDLKQEVFIVAMLDQKNQLIADDQISEGSLTETLVHPREVFAAALSNRAASIVVLHNHPSGDPAPSTQDKTLTKRLDAVAKLVGIRLLDHVIIGDGTYASFVDLGLMA